MSTTTAGPVVTYTAVVSTENREVDVLITRAVQAGINGPFGSFTLETGATLEQIAAGLMEQGFEVAGEWTAQACFDGLRLEAPVAPRIA